MTRKTLCLALLIPIAVLAAKIDPIGVQRVPYTGDDIRPVLTGKPIGQNPRPLEVIGTCDTCGGTMFDIWFNGPTSQLMFCDTNVGIHASFMYSNGTPSTDRNMRYNFFDLSMSPPAWAYNSGPDYMLWGVNTFDIRTGFGMLDASDATGCAWISSHYTGTSAIRPVVARDQAPGSGSFIYAPGEPNCSTGVWPAIGLTNSGKLHALLTKDEGSIRDKLYYTGIRTWPDWIVPIPFAEPDAGFPDYNIATSHRSNRVCGMWTHMDANPPTTPMRAYLRFSQNDGDTWDDPIELPFPPMFNHGDTLPTFDINSLFGIFDDRDSFHLVANLQPFLGGGVNWVPSAIWHWDFTNGWSLVNAAYSDTWNDPGSNASFAGRPTLCQAGDNDFVCVWEQLDSINVEPNTGQNRFRVMGSRSRDGGLTWGRTRALRGGGTSSYRYPVVARHAVADTVHMLYLEDLEAGFAAGTPPVGSMTPNPVIHQKFYKGELRQQGAVAEGRTPPTRVALDVTPNPFLDRAKFAYTIPQTGNISLKVFDKMGRIVRTLVNARANPGRYTSLWDGRSDGDVNLTAGVYFATLTTEKTRVSRKVMLLR